MTYLQSEAWLPPACDPARVMAEIHGRRYEACRGFSSAGGPIWSNVVERLAVAYALLRAHGESPQKPLIMWETLESIGHEVTPEFAELGSDAALLMEILEELLADHPVGVLRIDLAHRALGRLWSAAFSAPPGFEQHVARSASGAEPAELSFFHSTPPLGSPGGKALGRHLLALVDLLQAAVAMRDLPDTRVGLPIEIETQCKAALAASPAKCSSMPPSGAMSSRSPVLGIAWAIASMTPSTRNATCSPTPGPPW